MTTPIKSYKELIVWQKSIELVKEVYKATDKLPKAELYALTSQMRRAAVSIPSNIAEGYKRRNRGEYLQFLGIADASAAELLNAKRIKHKLWVLAFSCLFFVRLPKVGYGLSA